MHSGLTYSSWIFPLLTADNAGMSCCNCNIVMNLLCCSIISGERALLAAYKNCWEQCVAQRFAKASGKTNISLHKSLNGFYTHYTGSVIYSKYSRSSPAISPQRYPRPVGWTWAWYRCEEMTSSHVVLSYLPLP